MGMAIVFVSCIPSNSNVKTEIVSPSVKNIYPMLFANFSQMENANTKLDEQIRYILKTSGRFYPAMSIKNADAVISGRIERFAYKKGLAITNENSTNLIEALIFQLELYVSFKELKPEEKELISDKPILEVVAYPVCSNDTCVSNTIKSAEEKLIKQAAQHIVEVCTYGWQTDYGIIGKEGSLIKISTVEDKESGYKEGKPAYLPSIGGK